MSKSTRPWLGEPQQLTVAFVRDELRHNRYSGDVFKALQFMLGQYDEVWSAYQNSLQEITSLDRYIANLEEFN